MRGPDLDAASPMADADVRAVLTLGQGDARGEVLAATQHGQVVRLDGRHDLQTLGVVAKRAAGFITIGGRRQADVRFAEQF